MQRQAVEQLIVIQQILPNAVNHQMQKLVFLVQEQRHGKVANLFFGVLGCRDEVDGFEMPKVDVPAQDVYVEELMQSQSEIPALSASSRTHFADVFLLVISAQVAICTDVSVSDPASEEHKVGSAHL
jgi:hypothetical protein